MFLVLTDHINLFMKPNMLKKWIKEKAGGQKGDQKNKIKYTEREVHRCNKTTEIFLKLKF